MLKWIHSLPALDRATEFRGGLPAALQAALWAVHAGVSTQGFPKGRGKRPPPLNLGMARKSEVSGRLS